jgi:iron complex transport system substrate-binding protein
MRSPLPAALAAVCALLLTTVLTGCAAGADGTASSSATTTVAPSLADVRDDVLADPRSWEGPTSAVTAPTPVDPVTGPQPQLPVTVEDAQGTEVTVADTSRILALDLHGTLSRTVHELGLGGQVVGRDTSTQFAEAADLPLVTQNGHDLNAEAILALDPTVILTDTSLGPWDVVLQMRDAGIPVVVTDSHRGLDNLSSLTMEVADALGGPSASSPRSPPSPSRSRPSPRPTRPSGCARSSSMSAASRASTTSSARAAAPTPSSTRSASTTWPRRSAGTG